ncbi:hypothetical protein PAHAL_3G302600 [Panicum hallii]|uniref:Uncharacterized protein n=1 Tax=Panicum hallii TaxID=206008 RepID=A0A2S3HCQ2_9POAL|nr:hypothetical protein PAHAL_3G302600 [Panicum hallii]
MATAGVAVNSPFPQIHQASGSPGRHGVFLHAFLEVGPYGGGLSPSITGPQPPPTVKSRCDGHQQRNLGQEPQIPRTILSRLRICRDGGNHISQVGDHDTPLFLDQEW